MEQILSAGIIPMLAVRCPVCHTVFQLSLKNNTSVTDDDYILVKTEEAHMFADEDCLCGTDLIADLRAGVKCPLCLNKFTVNMKLEPTDAILLLPEDDIDDDILRREMAEDAGREVRGESPSGDPGEEG